MHEWMKYVNWNDEERIKRKGQITFTYESIIDYFHDCYQNEERIDGWNCA